MANETKIIITAATAQAEGALRGLGNSVAGLGSKFAAITGIGGALSVTAFAGLIKSSINAADELSKLSQKTGTSVEALAGLKFAADQNGTSLEAVARAGQKLATVMADKPELFTKLGITAKDSTGAMVQLADVFADMPDGLDKTALATKIFGDRLSAEMIPFLNQGTTALGNLVEQGKAYNPVTTESARQAELFNDQLDALKAQAGSLGVKLANDLLPGLVETTTAMSDLAREGHQVLALWRGLAGMGKVPWDFLMPPDNLRKELSSEGLIKDLQAQIGQLERNKESGSGKLMQWIFGTPQEIDAEIAMLKQRIEIIRKHAAELDKPPALPAPQAPDGSKGRALLGALGGGGEDKKQKPFDPEEDFWFAVDEAAMKNQQKRNEEYLKDLVKAEEEANQQMRRSALEAQRIIADTDPMARAGAEWDRLTDLVEQGLLTQEQAAQSYAKTFDETVDKTKEATDQMTVYAEQAGRNIQDAFSEFLFDPFKGGLSGMLDNFQIMLRRMAAEAIASNVLNSVGAWGKSGGGAGTFVGDILGSVFGGARAIGGPVAGGKSYLVGERGPEIFTPASSGNITPNDKIGKSVTVINNFTISTPTDRRTQEQIAAMAGASIQTAMMRGA